MNIRKKEPVGRSVKVSGEQWVDAARRSLLEEGISGVRVDRLAKRLGVTRGGFYHNFRDRERLLDELLLLWERDCRFLPENPPGTTPAQAIAWYDQLIARLIDEDGYDHNFDMAVREWSRSDKRAAWAVERSDHERLSTLEKFFGALGYNASEAKIRARVLYFHQIGYYAIGVTETPADRKRNVKLYTAILCGREAIDSARSVSQR